MNNLVNVKKSICNIQIDNAFASIDYSMAIKKTKCNSLQISIFIATIDFVPLTVTLSL